MARSFIHSVYFINNGDQMHWEMNEPQKSSHELDRIPLLTLGN